MKFKTIIEPFRIKMVEPIVMSSPKQRDKFLAEAHYNPFLLKSEQVIIDLLTDSGTSAMSQRQWSAMMLGDESYAGAHSWEKFEQTVHTLTGMPHILPTHQGRAAERILYSYIGKKGKFFFSNTHFDTTRANIEYSGATAIDLPTPKAKDHESDFHFKGNLDTNALEQSIAAYGAANVAAVILTITNNSGGGQPVSMENARNVSEICKKHNILFVLDCCRIAENSYFIHHYEEGYKTKTYKAIAQEMFALADAAIMSAKKDGLVNMGGFLALRDNKLADECMQLLIITEGFTTYGGLSGRDMEAIAVGLEEVFSPDYLHYRISSTQYLGRNLKKMGVPVLYPIGGHAVYIDAALLYPHILPQEYPGQALVCELYKTGGVRCVEIGSVMFGKYDTSGNLIPAPMELVRLAIPRRVYTQSHIDYVIEVFDHILQNRHQTKGLRITKEPQFLRHFTAHFEPLP
ncbi:MAG TPA: tryptophanase [Chitinophagales bacterium]|nr:tryptophanase [Chitinophagales bacterium]HRK26502.1 tryptophanase [Chitinophagales bacterium]